MDFEAYIIDAEYRSQWVASYPGDPMERPEGIYVTMTSTSVRQLTEWFRETFGAAAIRYYPNSDMAWDDSHWMTSHPSFRPIFVVQKKSDVALIKLRFQ